MLVKRKMSEIAMKGKEASKKEEDAYTTFQIVNEMLARGIQILRWIFTKSHAKKYLVEERGKIRLPFMSPFRCVGEAAANSLYEAKFCRPYISVDDLQGRSKVSKSVIETLDAAGSLKDLPASSQNDLVRLKIGVDSANFSMLL